jgi:hypothetical protein
MTVSTYIWILLRVTAAVLKFLDSAMRAVGGICGCIERIVYVMHRIVNQRCRNAVYMHYRVIVGLAVVAFFAARIGQCKDDEQEKNGSFH